MIFFFKGSEWNTLTTHRNMIKPEVFYIPFIFDFNYSLIQLINKKGEIIDPIKYSKANLSIKSGKF